MTTSSRYVGLDIHKRHVMVAAVNAQQDLVLAPQKVSMHHFPSWAQRHLQASDQVALEATSNTWTLHDQLKPLVEDVAVANTFQLKLISASASKTDKQDALVLAKLLAANLLPAVWVPPPHVRQLRRLTQHRIQLLNQRSALKNKLHAILHQQNLHLPDGDPFSKANQSWWTDLKINSIEALQIRHFWMSIDHFSQQLAETEAQIAQLSINHHWNEPMAFLMQLPGIGLYTGMTILAAIGDIARFPMLSNWSAMLAWAPGYVPQVTATALGKSLNKDDVNCVPRWLSVPGLRFTGPIIGVHAFMVFNNGSANIRRLSLLHVTFSRLSGICSPGAKRIDMATLKLLHDPS